MKTIRRFVAAAVVASALAACSGDPPPSREGEGLPEWTLAAEPAVRIGGGDGEGSLHQVTGAVRLADGRIAVANAGSRSLRVHDARGRLVREVGREGDGPGELRFPAWLGARGDTLLVWDPIARRMSRFHADGRFIDAARAPEEAGFFPRVVGAYGDGSVLFAAEGASPASAGAFRPPTALLHVTPDGAVADTVAVVPGSEQFASSTPDGRERKVEALPFGRQTVMALSGDVVYAGSGDDAQIRAIGRGGESRGFARAPWGARPVTRADVAAYWERLVTVGGRADDRAPTEGVPYPDSLPPYSAVHADRAGRVWVARALFPREWDQPAPWMVFSPSGEPLATVHLPPRSVLYDAGPGWVLLRQLDPDQREVVTLYPLSTPR
jgi:hypothetical protein